MAPSDDITWWSATRLAAAIARKEVASREALDHFADRIERLDRPVNAVVALDLDRAAERAAAADEAVARGGELGALHGMPITIKDSFQTEGIVTTSGSPDLADFVPEQDADPVARYRDAGAIVFGKTNLPIFAGDAQSFNAVYGTTSNPWDLERTPGGSSGGSGAALAAGFTPLELGSDIGGSIRIPSHWSGVVGHKPSYGIVSALGQIPGMPGTLTQADIAVAGPMARTVDDCELALDLLVGADRWHAPAYTIDLPPARTDRLDDLRVAVWFDEDTCPIDGGYRALLEDTAAALEDGGAKVGHDARPAFTFEKAVDTFFRLLSAAEAATWTLTELEEIAAAGADPQGELGIWHAAMRHREWLSANERRMQMRARWRELFEDWDVVLLPVTPTAAIPHDHSSPATARTITVDGTERPYFDIIKWMGLTGVSFLPATVVPIGTTAEGLPVGVQIAGPFLEDRTTLAAARHVERLMGGVQHPPGF